jgi:putative transposase
MRNDRCKQYKSDLSDQEWTVLKPLVPVNEGPGRKMTLSLRRVLEAIFYVVRTGCQWRAMPGDFPNWNSVYYHFRKWVKDGTWRLINAALCKLERQKRGRKPQPTGAVMDTQSVKTTALAQERGFDGHKRVKGHKRHILTDTIGNLLDVVVHTADIADCKGAPPLIKKVAETFPTIQKIWVDGAYKGDLVDLVKETLDAVLEIVEREAGQKGFQVLPKRWVVERTFAWFEWYRRLSRDYERLLECSASMIYLASIKMMLKRIAT